MSKHTPGPWIIDVENNLIHAVDNRHTIVCNFMATLKNPDVLADAQLIAAAPYLLAALKGVMLSVAGCVKDPMYEVARYAIAMAEGKGP